MALAIRIFGALGAGASAILVVLLSYPGDAVSQTVLLATGCVAAGASAIAAYLSKPETTTFAP